MIILEVGLRTFTIFPIGKTKVNHEILGWVMDSNMAEIDEHGFRNNTLSSIDIVALGDSHTYGFNVSSDNSWPKLLARKLDKTVYNFGVGGYGILQYQYLLDKSIELDPKVILLGLYLPNDLNDICRLVSTNQYWSSRAKEFNINSSLCNESQKRKNISKKKRPSVSKWLKEKSATISIALEYNSYFSTLRKIENNEIRNAVVINDKKTKTIINHKRIKQHKKYMDVNEPQIKMAYEVLKHIFLKANKNFETNNIRFGILFIPSKERVFYQYLMQRGYDLPIEYKELVDNEDELKANITRFLSEAGIPSIDILQDMENALLKYENIYLPSDNGHPIENGYQIYAENAFKLYQRIVQ